MSGKWKRLNKMAIQSNNQTRVNQKWIKSNTYISQVVSYVMPLFFYF